MRTVTRERELPPAVRSLTALADAHYFDVFTIGADGASRHSPEEWARAGIDRAAGLAGQFVWRVILGLRLAPRSSPDHVAGWAIAERDERWIRLEAASWCMTAHIVVVLGDDRVSVATAIRYDRRPAAVIWPPLSAVHRRAMPGLLGKASRVMERNRALL